MNRPKFTRGQLVRLAASSSIAGAVALEGVAGAEAAGPDSGLAVGTLEAIRSPQSATVGLQDGSTVRLDVEPSAFLGQGLRGAVNDLSAFEVGEEIAIHGRREGATFRASEVQSIYRAVRGSVVSDDGRELETTAGTLTFPQSIRRRSGVSRLRIGESFHANVWVHPRTGALLVADLMT